MTYLLLDLLFVGVAGVVLLVARRAVEAGGGGTPRRTRPSGGAIAWTILVLAVMTAVFDNLMIAVGLVAYADEHLVGLVVGLAPVEDFAYPLAAALLLPAVWHLLGARGTTPAPAAAQASGEAADASGRDS